MPCKRAANTFSLTYPEKLKVRSGIKFDALPFIIIAILGYLLSYKLTSYLADFKVEKHYSRLDIVFIIVCFIILLIPASKISQNKSSPEEARLLAVWKPFIFKDNKINYNFGKNYDSWFNDRFHFRTELISFYKNIKERIAYDYCELGSWYIFKSNKFIFSKRNLNNFSDREKFQIKENLTRIANLCKKNNIKLYIAIAPCKESIYKDFNKIYVDKTLGEPSTSDLINYLNNNSNLNIIYSEKAFLNYRKNPDKKDMLYFKMDHHLTDTSSFILYKLIINRMKKSFPDISLHGAEEFNKSYNNLVRWDSNRMYTPGREYHKTLIRDKSFLTDTNYLYYDYKFPEKISVTGKYPHFIHTNDSEKYHLLLIGDSYQENLSYFLNTSFRKIDKYRVESGKLKLLNLDSYKDLILETKPDILLLVFSSPAIRSY